MAVPFSSAFGLACRPGCGLGPASCPMPHGGFDAPGGSAGDAVLAPPRVLPSGLHGAVVGARLLRSARLLGREDTPHGSRSGCCSVGAASRFTGR